MMRVSRRLPRWGLALPGLQYARTLDKTPRAEPLKAAFAKASKKQ
jgi:hypothetical protein